MRLENRKALVTGGTRGIGRATVLRLAEEGADVAVASTNEGLLREVAALIQEKGRKAVTVRCDLTKTKEIDHLFAVVEEKMGTLDILVNNVGGSQEHSLHLLDITEGQFDEIINLNLKSNFLCTQRAIKMMLKGENGGTIVNISSQAGRFGNEFSRPHYSAAKAGVIGLTRHVAREFGPYRIRANVVASGYCMSGKRINDRWKERQKEGVFELLLNSVALRRISLPEEQAAVIVFLCTDDASYITGATIDVNGGKICI